MLPSGRRLLSLFVVIAGFPSLVFAQRVSSAGTAESTTAFRSSLKPTSLSFKTRSFYDGHDFSNTSENQVSNLVPQVTSTPFGTESRLPVAPLLGSRVQLNFSVMTPHSANVMLGPLPARATLHAPPQTRSADLYGFGVSIPLGRAAHIQPSSNDLLHGLRNAMQILRDN